jgi:hypothetical protein
MTDVWLQSELYRVVLCKRYKSLMRVLIPKWTFLDQPCGPWLIVYIGLCSELVFVLASLLVLPPRPPPCTPEPADHCHPTSHVLASKAIPPAPWSPPRRTSPPFPSAHSACAVHSFSSSHQAPFSYISRTIFSSGVVVP